MTAPLDAAPKPSVATTIDVHFSSTHLPINAVLLSGAEELVLVDTCMSVKDAHVLVDRIRSTGKTLTTVLLTHAHPDHYFGHEVVREAFPQARFLARRGVRETLIEWPAKVRHWGEVFGLDDIPHHFTLPEELPDGPIDLEGEAIEVIDLYGTECIYMTVFYVPSSGTLIAGDAIYSGIHLLTGDVHNLPAWIGELERLKAGWDIRAVIPGHGPGGGPDLIDANIDYLRTLEGISRPGRRVAEVAPEITAAYPEYMLPQIPWTTRGPGYGFLGPESIGFPKDLPPTLLPPA